jgi:cellulose biosynthesis protein BcsQ
MGKLRLVIADEDEGYVESLTGFLMSNYPQRFQIGSFTKPEYLEKFLSDNECRVDILLVSPAFTVAQGWKKKAGTVIILYEGKHSGKVNGCECVNKYQHGDILVSAILDISSGDGKTGLAQTGGTRNTRIVSVYSPIGGAGKTSIAANICIQCSRRGLKAFYLNLENAHSTPCYFDGSSEYNLSHVFFYLKDRDCNLGMKLEGLKSIDTTYNVHFFMPPDTILEMDEMLPEDYRCLIRQFRQIGSYDVVVVDMDSNFESRNMALLEMSDEILLVAGEDYVSKAKMAAFFRQLELLSDKDSFNIYEKIKPVVNKHAGSQITDSGAAAFQGLQVSLKLPFIQQDGNGQRHSNIADDGFGMELFRWTAKYVRS